MKRLFAVILLFALTTGISANALATAVDFSGATTPIDITRPNAAFTSNGVAISYGPSVGTDTASVDINGVDGNTNGTLILTFDTNATALYLNFTIVGVATHSNTVDALVFQTYSSGNPVDSNSITAIYNSSSGNSVGSLAYSGAPFDTVYLLFSPDGPNFIATDINYYDPNQLPGAPTSVAAVGSNAQATVGFTAPASDGGFPITQYTVTSSDGNTGTGTASPITVTGLTNGTPYSFTVTATNIAGTGPASLASNSVTPAPIAPGAPTIGTATAGNAQATVSFTAPADDGGSAITSYTVTSNPDGKIGTGASSPITVTGLTNGISYSFTVTATNGVPLTSSASRASNTVTPSGGSTPPPTTTAPGAPTIGTATAGNAQATVSFTAPASDGGSAITLYTATSSPGGLTGTGTASPITVTGLTNGTAYTFTVTATNGVGTGAASAASNRVTPTKTGAETTVPGAPTIGTAAAGNAQATVSFTPPASDGGSAITLYTVTSSPDGKTGTGTTASPITVTGLTNGTAYTFTVTATNTAGTGPASAASNSVTPTAPTVAPAAPTTLVATASILSVNPPTVRLTWRDNSNNEDGFTIQRATNTKFTKGLATFTVGTNVTTYTDTAVLIKTKYYYRVMATNTIGNSAFTKVVHVTTAGQLPAAPTNLATGTVTTKSVVLTWTDNATNETGFKIQRSTNATFAKGVSSTTVNKPNLTTRTMTGLRKNKTYYYRVAAHNKYGNSEWSNVVTITTALP
jgi:titin